MASNEYTNFSLSIVKRPVHPILLPFPAACLIGTLLTDLAYWRTAEMMWADFSAWLVTVGVILSCLAAIAGLIDLFGGRYTERSGTVALYAAGNVVVLILAALNMLIHSRDAWTSVVPWGLVLSAATVIVLLFTVWLGWSKVYRYRAGDLSS
jgi:uncharacterized membrane protein